MVVGVTRRIKMWFVFWVMLKIWWFWFLGGVELGNCKELSFTAIVEG